MDKENVYHLDIKEEETLKTFLFMGRSGCGKGTQAKLLIDHLKSKSETPVFYLGTGPMFRELITEDSLSGKLAKKIYDEGGLQPEFMAVWAWSHLMVENLRGDEHLILDGMPRRFHEAPILDSALKFYQREKPFFININVSNQWSKEKMLKRGRVDDTDAEIKKRLDWFDTEVIPAIDYFRQNSTYKFIEVDGERSIEEIHKDLIKNIFQQ